MAAVGECWTKDECLEVVAPNPQLARLSSFIEVSTWIILSDNKSSFGYSQRHNHIGTKKYRLIAILVCWDQGTVYRIFSSCWGERWSESQGGVIFLSSAPDCRDAAGFLLQLVQARGALQMGGGRGSGELCRCCPASCVGQSFNDLRRHKILIQQSFIPGLPTVREWKTQL